MPPQLALILTLGFIFFLFRRDRREQPNVTSALWIPIWWTLITCSREVNEWLELFGLPGGGGSLEEGTPVNRLFYLAMIAAGFNVLRKRWVRVSELARNNAWLTVFLVYAFLSVFWSDFTFVSLKRWIKVLGHPIMALIILTEPDPQEAVVRLIKRCGYVLLPVSVLFVKYYPEHGRGFDNWTGAAYNTGITTDKNLLGINCLILGYVLIWQLIKTLQLPKSKERRDELALCGVLLWMNFWLFFISDSKTPLVALLLGCAVLYFVGLRWVNRRMIGFYFVASALVAVVAQTVFGVYEIALGLLGREANLTDRTRVWADCLKVDINPLFGTGFESFWMGERLEAMWALWNFHPNQAHNGYLETYLNLGLVGLFLLLALILATYGKACRSLYTDLNWGRFRLGFLVAIVVYNWTEAAFKCTHPIFFFFYVIALDVPVRRLVGPAEEPFEELSELEAAPTEGPRTTNLRPA